MRHMLSKRLEVAWWEVHGHEVHLGMGRTQGGEETAVRQKQPEREEAKSLGSRESSGCLPGMEGQNSRLQMFPW